MCSVSSHHITHLPALTVANTNLTRLHATRSAQLGPIHGCGTVNVNYVNAKYLFRSTTTTDYHLHKILNKTVTEKGIG